MDPNWDKREVLFSALIVVSVESEGCVRAIRRISDLQSLRFSSANDVKNILPSLLQQLLFGIQMFLRSDFTRQTPTIV